MTGLIRHSFQVEGMHCASCTMLIDEVVEELDGVRRSQTSLRNGLAVVDYDPLLCTPTAVLGAIAEAGYSATVAPGQEGQ